MAIEVIPAVIPHLVVDDGAGAIDFYVKAFGATELGRTPADHEQGEPRERPEH